MALPPRPPGGAQAAAACTRRSAFRSPLGVGRGRSALPLPEALSSRASLSPQGSSRRYAPRPEAALAGLALPYTPPAPQGSRRRPPPAPGHTYDAASIALQRSTLPRSSSVQPPVPCNAHRFRLRASRRGTPEHRAQGKNQGQEHGQNPREGQSLHYNIVE